MKFKIIILALSFSIFVLALEKDPELQRNILRFGYSINYKHEGQLCHSINRFNVVAKLQLPKLNDLARIFWKMAVDYKNCDYLSPHNSPQYAHLLEGVKNGQAQHIRLCI